MKLINDFSTSVRKALSEIDPKWESYDGLIICGTHAPTEIDKTLSLIHLARTTNTPTLGICAGLQMMAIEYSRNVLGIEDATSEEFGDGTFVVEKMKDLVVGLKDGESYWHNYAVRPDIFEKLVKNAMSPRFIGVQYHPEYQSSKDNKHPLLVNFINECKNQ